MRLKGLWQTGRVAISAHRLADRIFYDQVAEEMQRGARDEALWLMAYERAIGKEQETKAFYIRLRVQALKDEQIIIDAVQRAAGPPSNGHSPIYASVETSDPTQKPNDGGATIVFVVVGVIFLMVTLALALVSQ